MGEERNINRIFHRSHFKRPVYKGVPVDMSKVKRDYLWCEQDFQQTLNEFNQTIAPQQGELYECVGYVNVRLQICFLCFDAQKKKGKERYYVNKLQLAFHRKNICHSCLGHKLRLFAS